MEKCEACKGTGECLECFNEYDEDCEECGGNGVCNECGGSGDG